MPDDLEPTFYTAEELIAGLEKKVEEYEERIRKVEVALAYVQEFIISDK